MESDKRLDAHKKLIDIAAVKGYVTVDIIMDCSDEFELSIPDFDWITNEVASRNIIIYDNEPSTREIDEDEDVDDYAQIDYEAIYAEIVSACPTLEGFVDVVRSIRPPQFKETSQLKYLVKEGNAHARQRMIEMHLRLALKIGYQRAKAYDADIEETVGDACVGLINAVDKYDPDTSGPFSSYASLWILQNVTREQPTQNPQIYFPVHKREDYYAVYPLLKENGYLEYADLEHNARAIDLICKKLGYKADQLDDIWKAVIPFESLDAFVVSSEEDDRRLHPLFGAARLPLEDAIVESLDQELLRRRMEKVLGSLTPREEMVLKLRYGLENGKEFTLEEVGQEFKVTRERIRQIEAKAIRKIQHQSRRRYLRGFIPEKLTHDVVIEAKQEKKRKRSKRSS